jgi:hypothetical protein
MLALVLMSLATPALAKKPDKPGKPGGSEPTITLFACEEPYTDYVDFLGVCQFESWKVTANRPGTMTFWAYREADDELLATGEVGRIGEMIYDFPCDGPQELTIRHDVELANKKGEVIATAENTCEFSFLEHPGPQSP